MWKVAALIIFEWIQFSGRPSSSSRYQETFLAKGTGEVAGRTSLFSKHSYQNNSSANNTSEATGRSIVVYPDCVFKTSATIVAGRQKDAHTIEVPGVYTLLGKPKVISTASNTPWDKESSVRNHQ